MYTLRAGEQDLDLDAGMVTFRGGFPPGPYHMVENRGLSNESAVSARRARPAGGQIILKSTPEIPALLFRIDVSDKILLSDTLTNQNPIGWMSNVVPAIAFTVMVLTSILAE